MCLGYPSKAAIRLGKPAFKLVDGEGLETTYYGMLASGLSGWCSYSLNYLVGVGLMDAKGEYHPFDGRKKLQAVVPDMSRPGMIWPRECFERIFLGDGDTKDIHMLTRQSSNAGAAVRRLRGALGASLCRGQILISTR
mgnify:CR=1 FL=1